MQIPEPTSEGGLSRAGGRESKGPAEMGGGAVRGAWWVSRELAAIERSGRLLQGPGRLAAASSKEARGPDTPQSQGEGVKSGRTGQAGGLGAFRPQ